MHSSTPRNAAFRTLEFTGTALRLLDQTRLPGEEVYVECRTYEEVADAIRDMVVRGAPAIGVAAAFGVLLAAQEVSSQDGQELLAHLAMAAKTLQETRPTAVNLRWGVRRMLGVAQAAHERGAQAPEMQAVLGAEAEAIYQEDIAINQAIGNHGAALLRHGDTVLTHCNAGALATAGYGTALGVIRSAVSAGKQITVFADETRPFLQGARLTAWELHKDNIPVTLITDNMAGYFMQLGRISAVVVGADRIAANGDVANKIGTYSVALLAQAHHIPFYVAAPRSTIDLETASGVDIPIEERSGREVSHLHDYQLAPDGIEIANPAFDVTPASLVAAIITECGVVRPPYGEHLPRLFSETPTT